MHLNAFHIEKLHQFNLFVCLLIQHAYVWLNYKIFIYIVSLNNDISYSNFVNTVLSLYTNSFAIFDNIYIFLYIMIIQNCIHKADYTLKCVIIGQSGQQAKPSLPYIYKISHIQNHRQHFLQVLLYNLHAKFPNKTLKQAANKHYS